MFIELTVLKTGTKILLANASIKAVLREDKMHAKLITNVELFKTPVVVESYEEVCAMLLPARDHEPWGKHAGAIIGAPSFSSKKSDFSTVSTDGFSTTKPDPIAGGAAVVVQPGAPAAKKVIDPLDESEDD